MRGSGPRRSRPSTSPAFTAVMLRSRLGGEDRGDAGLDLVGEQLGETDLGIPGGAQAGEALGRAVVGGGALGNALGDDAVADERLDLVGGGADQGRGLGRPVIELTIGVCTVSLAARVRRYFFSEGWPEPSRSKTSSLRR